MQHEYAHQVDFLMLNDPTRQALAAVRAAAKATPARVARLLAAVKAAVRPAR